MSERPPVELVYERVPDDQRRALHVSLYPICEQDEAAQGLTIPNYNYRAFTVAAKAADGTLLGGLSAETAWNELCINAIAANPEHRMKGVGTALMQYAETMARTVYGCNRMRLDVFDWQPRGFFEAFGFKVFGAQEDHPRGHTKYFVEKIWSAESASEALQGYDKAATDVVMEPWADPEGLTTLKKWIQQDTEARTAQLPHPVGDPGRQLFAIKVTYPDGTFAAGVVCVVVWNELHVNMFAVATAGQRRGVGSAVLTKLNEVAREHDCAYIGLETSSWQGRPFYERNGFTCFSTQYDVPEGFQRYRLYRPVPQE